MKRKTPATCESDEQPASSSKSSRAPLGLECSLCRINGSEPAMHHHVLRFAACRKSGHYLCMNCLRNSLPKTCGQDPNTMLIDMSKVQCFLCRAAPTAVDRFLGAPRLSVLPRRETAKSEPVYRSLIEILSNRSVFAPPPRDFLCTLGDEAKWECGLCQDGVKRTALELYDEHALSDECRQHLEKTWAGTCPRAGCDATFRSDRQRRYHLMFECRHDPPGPFWSWQLSRYAKLLLLSLANRPPAFPSPVSLLERAPPEVMDMSRPIVAVSGELYFSGRMLAHSVGGDALFRGLADRATAEASELTPDTGRLPPFTRLNQLALQTLVVQKHWQFVCRGALSATTLLPALGEILDGPTLQHAIFLLATTSLPHVTSDHVCAALFHVLQHLDDYLKEPYFCKWLVDNWFPLFWTTRQLSTTAVAFESRPLLIYLSRLMYDCGLVLESTASQRARKCLLVAALLWNSTSAEARAFTARREQSILTFWTGTRGGPYPTSSLIQLSLDLPSGVLSTDGTLDVFLRSHVASPPPACLACGLMDLQKKAGSDATITLARLMRILSSEVRHATSDGTSQLEKMLANPRLTQPFLLLTAMIGHLALTRPTSLRLALPEHMHTLIAENHPDIALFSPTTWPCSVPLSRTHPPAALRSFVGTPYLLARPV